MKYFISQSSACRAYTKCWGWQETLVHFFVKNRRSSSSQVPAYRSLSEDVLGELKEHADNPSHRTFFDIRIHSDSPLAEKAFRKPVFDNLVFSQDLSESGELTVSSPAFRSLADSREDLLTFSRTDSSMDTLSEQSSPKGPMSPSMKKTFLDDDNDRPIIDDLRRVLGLI